MYTNKNKSAVAWLTRNINKTSTNNGRPLSEHLIYMYVYVFLYDFYISKLSPKS